MQNKCIFLAGHKGMLGRSLSKRLQRDPRYDLLTATRSQLNLLNQQQVTAFFETNKIDIVILAAAKVGGIKASTDNPYHFILENLQIQNNVISSAVSAKVPQLVFIGSSCIYPRECPQPMREEYLLTGVLEKTLEQYALAKIAGIKLCQAANEQYGFDYRCVMPCNLYGPNDNFHLTNSHVIPALIRKAHAAKTFGNSELTVWGSGRALREFLHVDDLSAAISFLLNLDRKTFHHNCPPDGPYINIGAGSDISIKDLVKKISEIVGFNGAIKFDNRHPDGTPRKLLDSSRLYNLGWRPNQSFDDGLTQTYQWFLKNEKTLRQV